MVQVELSSATFARLQRLAIPLVDSIETVVGRIVDFYEGNQPVPKQGKPPSAPATPQSYDPAFPPNLTHTKVLSISFNGKNLAKATWNGLLIVAVHEAKARSKTPEDLKRLIIVPFVVGAKIDEGYKYLSDIGLSIQGQDANSSWKAAYHIANQLRLPIEAEFVWRHKEGAEFPGKAARLIG